MSKKFSSGTKNTKQTNEWSFPIEFVLISVVTQASYSNLFLVLYRFLSLFDSIKQKKTLQNSKPSDNMLLLEEYFLKVLFSK